MIPAEPPWDDLDPGIYSVVRELWCLGFQTTDSGDGRYKGTIDYDPVAFETTPHVYIAVRPRELEQEADRLIEWMLDQTFEEDSVEISAFPYIVSLVDTTVPVGWMLRIAGEGLYNYVPR
jgi:hypothetical protein